jgi:hypothetical protein
MSSLIRNYLGFSRGLSGAELVQRGYMATSVEHIHEAAGVSLRSRARGPPLRPSARSGRLPPAPPGRRTASAWRCGSSRRAAGSQHARS